VNSRCLVIELTASLIGTLAAYPTRPTGGSVMDEVDVILILLTSIFGVAFGAWLVWPWLPRN